MHVTVVLLEGPSYSYVFSYTITLLYLLRSSRSMSTISNIIRMCPLLAVAVFGTLVLTFLYVFITFAV